MFTFYKIPLLVVCLFIGCNAISQNPILITAPHYVQKTSSGSTVYLLPTGSNPSLTYQGQPAQYSSNAFADENGDLKCFIIDGIVYDHAGYIIGQFNPIGTSDAFGRSELSMVPDPGNCDRIYLFGITRNYASGSSKDISFYSRIDFSQNSDISGNTNRLGLVETPTQIFASSLLKDGNGFISISKKRSDNSHFVFISNSGNIRKYKLDTNGLSYINSIAIPDSYVNTFVRGEMELFENTNPNQAYTYRIAVPYFKQSIYATPGIPDEYIHAIYVAKLDVNGNLISNSDFVLNYQNYIKRNHLLKA